VVGIDRATEVVVVAADARSIQSNELTAHVAGLAVERHMRAGQGELCLVVLESGSDPGRGRVTERAVVRKTGRKVIRRRCLGEIIQVAAHACGVEPGELSSDVTGFATDRDVGSGQRERVRCMTLEESTLPSAHGMTILAVGWETQREVVNGSRFVFGRMTRDTQSADAGERSGRGTGMTRFTAFGSMRTLKRKPIEMCLDRFNGKLPVQFRVAVLARRAELPAVNVGMAVRATGLDFGEESLRMAARAFGVCMAADKWPSRL